MEDGILDSKIRTSRGIFSRIFRKVLIPDAQIFWIPTAFIRGWYYIKKNQCDIVYSSFPPASAHLVALFLHYFTGLPWTADFRDSWIFDPLDSDLQKSGWRRAIEQYLEFKVISNQKFVESLTSCYGVICNAGFETPSEALFLGKRLIVIPLKGQYEQKCNAIALKNMDIPTIKKLNINSLLLINNWLESKPKKITFNCSLESLLKNKIRQINLNFINT